jgi:hypothetical protein
MLCWEFLCFGVSSGWEWEGVCCAVILVGLYANKADCDCVCVSDVC